MKKILGIIIILLISTNCFSQFVGIGAQYADAKGKGNAIQFAANVSYPYFHKKNPLNIFVAGGVDYTGGSSPVSGFNVKPIQINSFISESLFNNNKFTLLVGCDAGYIFNHRHGEDGIVITPNIYFDYKYFFVKSGYDMNVSKGERQFFVRAGISFGMGAIKSFAKTKIW